MAVESRLTLVVDLATFQRILMTFGRAFSWLSWLALAAVLGWLSSSAAAQSNEGRDDPQYRHLIRKALEEFDRGNLSEAKLFFSDAHALYPNARTLRGLGLVAYAMRNYVQASDLLDQALAHSVQPLTDEMRTSASNTLAESRRFEARVRIEVQPRGAQLSIDDRPVSYDAEGTARLNPGAHEITARSTGYDDVSRQVSIDAGERRSVQLQLRPVAQTVRAAAPTVPAPAAKSDETPFVSREPTPEKEIDIVPWLTLGVSGAVAITGGVLLGVSLSSVSSLEDPKPRTQWSSVQSKYDATPAMSGLGITMLSVGLAGTTVALTWLLWPKSRSEGQATVAVSPLGVYVGLPL